MDSTPVPVSSTSTISDREREQIDRANATTTTPVVFIHGLWLLPSSWDPWAALFEEAGYVALTPDWPDDPESVEVARAEPEVLAHKTLEQVAEHTTEVIKALDKKPVLIGHSTGGLEAEMLAGRGLAAVTVAIDPGVFRGVLPLPLVGAPRRRPLPDQSENARQGDHAHVRPVQIRLDERAGRGRGDGAVRQVPCRRLRDVSRADGQREPQPVDRGEGGHQQSRAGTAADHRRREGPAPCRGRSRTLPTSGRSTTRGSQRSSRFRTAATRSPSTMAGKRSPRSRWRSSRGSIESDGRSARQLRGGHQATVSAAGSRFDGRSRSTFGTSRMSDRTRTKSRTVSRKARCRAMVPGRPTRSSCSAGGLRQANPPDLRPASTALRRCRTLLDLMVDRSGSSLLTA